MAYASDTDLTTRVPATLAASSALRLVALSDAEAMIDDEQFGLRAVRAHCMLAAHYLTIDGTIAGGEGGLVTQRSAGEISVSYAVTVPGGYDPLLGTTRYGRAFLEILASLVSMPEVG